MALSSHTVCDGCAESRQVGGDNVETERESTERRITP